LLTSGTLHRHIGATGQWIAAVVCAKIAIVAIQGCTRLAIIDRIAGFAAVADVAVVAGSVIGRVYAGVIDLVAGIRGTANPVIAVGRRARLTGAGSGVTGLLTIAEKFIGAVRVNCALGYDYTFAGPSITLLTFGTHHRVIGATGQWIAAVICAKIAIVAIQRCTGLAIEYGITGFDAVADIAVVTISIVRRVHAAGSRIAGIHRACNIVIAVQRYTCLTLPRSQVAGLVAIAGVVIVAIGVTCARLTIGIIPVVRKVTIVIQAGRPKYALLSD
jgi:hypothetical protein